MEFREHIEAIIKNTFNVIDEVYRNSTSPSIHMSWPKRPFLQLLSTRYSPTVMVSRSNWTPTFTTLLPSVW